MKAIILAAGVGSRLGADRPKCMLAVGGISIIHRQLAAFRSVGIQSFVIVVGHEQERVMEHLADQPGNITFVPNPRYRETNTIYSLYLARDQFDGGFWFANGDVVFDRRLTARLHAFSESTVLATRRTVCGAEEVKVMLRDGRVVHVGKGLAPETCQGEFVGIARFGADQAGRLVSPLTRLVEQEAEIRDYFERALDLLCPEERVLACDVTDLPCREVDFPHDLEAARQTIAPRLLD